MDFWKKPFLLACSKVCKYHEIFFLITSLIWYLSSSKSLTHTTSINGPYQNPQEDEIQTYSPWVVTSKVHGFYDYLKKYYIILYITYIFKLGFSNHQSYSRFFLNLYTSHQQGEKKRYHSKFKACILEHTM